MLVGSAKLQLCGEYLDLCPAGFHQGSSGGVDVDLAQQGVKWGYHGKTYFFMENYGNSLKNGGIYQQPWEYKSIYGRFMGM